MRNQLQDQYNRIRTIIIEDQQETINLLRQAILRKNNFEITAESNTGLEGVKAIHLYQPDLVILSASGERIDGFEVMNKVRAVKKPLYVLLSDHEKNAVKAFDAFAFDFLLKPLQTSRFDLTLFKVEENLNIRSSGQIDGKLNALYRYIQLKDNNSKRGNGKRLELLPIKMAGKIFFINIDDIEYIVASGYYVEIHAKGKKHLVRQSLNSIGENLDGNQFIRIHRSVIINLHHLNEVIRSGANDFNVRLKSGELFKISKSYKNAVFETLRI